MFEFSTTPLSVGKAVKASMKLCKDTFVKILPLATVAALLQGFNYSIMPTQNLDALHTL